MQLDQTCASASIPTLASYGSYLLSSNLRGTKLNINPELTLYSSKNFCTRTNDIFIPSSYFSEGQVSLIQPQQGPIVTHPNLARAQYYSSNFSEGPVSVIQLQQGPVVTHPTLAGARCHSPKLAMALCHSSNFSEGPVSLIEL